MPGSTSQASRSNSKTAPAVGWASKPCSSSLAPTINSPSLRGTRYTSGVRTTCCTSGSPRSRSSCPFTGRSPSGGAGVSSRSSLHTPAAITATSATSSPDSPQAIRTPPASGKTPETRVCRRSSTPRRSTASASAGSSRRGSIWWSSSTSSPPTARGVTYGSSSRTSRAPTIREVSPRSRWSAARCSSSSSSSRCRAAHSAPSLR